MKLRQLCKAFVCLSTPQSNPGCALCYSFRKGRQEDAHEYLVALLDAMHEAQVAGVQPRPPTDVAQTSLIYSIFAGRVRSQVSTFVNPGPT